MAGRLGSAPAGGPEPRSLPPLLTGAASRPGDSRGCPHGAEGRHGDPGKASEGLGVPQVLPATAAAASAGTAAAASASSAGTAAASAPSAGTAAAASAPSAGTAAASAASAGAAAAPAARPAVAQEPLQRRQMYLCTMYVNNDYRLETEKNYHFCQLGCRKIWTSGFHKWAEALCPVTLSSYMFKLCHNGNSAAESAVIYPMWPSAEAIILSELTVHPFFSSWYIN
ncbi:ESX-1 secretion-associated protein EspK-like isoform X5 [Camelus ferus]|uniref:ESX-1 secretion-associated protein EspK-like isoform X5 n=1 Tax=Camelus ferus TaxID=419612 RepID=A0A8B8SLB9_CAMFR|nr:ESX-1 secretion-associated protein EspK-like isoform X5 [Camelus ferus]